LDCVLGSREAHVAEEYCMLGAQPMRPYTNAQTAISLKPLTNISPP
jgi:hypothetical protein